MVGQKYFKEGEENGCLRGKHILTINNNSENFRGGGKIAARGAFAPLVAGLVLYEKLSIPYQYPRLTFFQFSLYM